MKIRFRLAEILDICNVPRHGAIQHICNNTNLDRHQVTTLMNNTVKRVPLTVLGEICNYLIEKKRVDPERLPAWLFELEMDEFWAMLAERTHIEVSFGMRKSLTGPVGPWVMATDSFLHGALLHELFGMRHTREGRQPHVFKQRMITAFRNQKDLQSEPKVRAVIDEAFNAYSEFRSIPGSKALICIGSVKSNYMAEAVMADMFETQPFVSQDEITSAMDRSCPVYFLYRENDPKPFSCYGGSKLSKKKRKPIHGIYYETVNSGWKCCPSNEDQDAALVAYAFHPSRGRLEVIMAGFSGRATESLAANLNSLGANFWPPWSNEGKVEIGVFIVTFDYHKSKTERGKIMGRTLDGTPFLAKVIRLNDDILIKRFKKTP